jgi:hypothetical protein
MVMWGIAITWRPSTSVVVVIVVVVCVLSHFNPLLWNQRTNWNQTWYECSLDDPLKSAVDPKYTKQPRGPNVSKMIFNFLLWNHWTNWSQTWHECSFDGPIRCVCFCLLTGSTQNEQETQKMSKRVLCMWSVYFSTNPDCFSSLYYL